MAAPTTVTQPPKRSRGCISCLGCLGVLLVIVILCGGTWFVGPALLRGVGLLEESAEEVYSGAPDPVASEALDAILVDSGFEGASAMVLPIKGRNSHLAVVTMDSSTKVKDPGKGAAEEAFMKTLRGLSGESVAGFNIERLVASFVDKNGDPLVAMTVPQKDVDDFVNGRTKRSDMLAEMDVDLSGLLEPGRIQTFIRGEIGELVESGIDAEFAAELAIGWADANNLIDVGCPPPYDGPGCSFTPNPVEIARVQASKNALTGFGMGLVGQRTMDNEASTALDAAHVAANVSKANALADEGLRANDTEQIDKAIGLRPKDWSIRDRLAAAELARGNEAAAQQAFDDAEDLVNDQIKDGGDCKGLRLNMLRNRQRVISRAAEEQSDNSLLTSQRSAVEAQISAVENDAPGSACQ